MILHIFRRFFFNVKVPANAYFTRFIRFFCSVSFPCKNTVFRKFVDKSWMEKVDYTVIKFSISLYLPIVIPLTLSRSESCSY